MQAKSSKFEKSHYKSSLQNKYEQKIDASNRLNSNQKRYVTYTMEYKKRIIQEVK